MTDTADSPRNSQTYLFFSENDDDEIMEDYEEEADENGEENEGTEGDLEKVERVSFSEQREPQGEEEVSFTEQQEPQEEEEEEILDPLEILTKEEMSLIKEKYEEWLDKKTKAFPVSMLGPILHLLGMTPSMIELDNYAKKFDSNKTGWLKIESLNMAAAIQRTSSEPITIDQVDEAFKFLVQKYPTTQKLISELLTICEPLSYDEANIMRKAAASKTNKGYFDIEKLLKLIDPKRGKKPKGGSKKGKGKGKKKGKK